jgi:hypothetical protein
MSNLNISLTKSTPKVDGDFENGTLKIKGNCFPENSILFFDEILNWMDQLPSSLSKFSLDCELNYIASSSVMHFYKLIQKTEEIFNSEKIEVTWKYEEDDEDIQNLGEEFQKLSNGKVNLVPLKSN